MRQNKQAMRKMNEDKDMNPMMQGQMRGMMSDTTSMMQMMHNPERMQKMMKMLHQQGMMSDDCMKAGMKKMKKMQKMNRKKGKGMKMDSDDSDHSSHH